jgi:uncharacterized protein (TIGR02145 family)
MSKPKLILLSILTLFFAGLIISPSSASVLSNRYKQYKAKYKNKEDKQNYFKIKTLKKDHPKLFSYYKSICDTHKFDTQKQFEKLTPKTQEMCNQYYDYRGYKQYVNYRNKYRNNNGSDDETTIAETPFSCGTDTVEDADGNEYDTVEVGAQCWMGENLNVGTMLVSGPTDPANNSITEKWCYNNNPAICATDGGLYNWNEAMQYVTMEGAQGICPVGWHIPKESEVLAMVSYLGADAYYKLATWVPNGTNSSGFTAIASGVMQSGVGFVGRPDSSDIWSSTYQDLGTSAYNLFIVNIEGMKDWLTGNASGIVNGQSVRCLKD